jgi:hypothetical protein
VIALANATIVAAELSHSAEAHDPNERLSVQFRVRKISGTYGETGDSFSDAWNA